MLRADAGAVAATMTVWPGGGGWLGPSATGCATMGGGGAPGGAERAREGGGSAGGIDSSQDSTVALMASGGSPQQLGARCTTSLCSLLLSWLCSSVFSWLS